MHVRYTSHMEVRVENIMATKRQHFWSEEETTLKLHLMKELNILKHLDGRKHRNADMFQKVSDKMAETRFHRSVEQIHF